MIRFTQLLLLICVAFLLLGCEKEQEHASQTELTHAVKQLNALLYVRKGESDNLFWPMTDPYLTKRDKLFKQLLHITADTQPEIQLLAIEQRFTERFFPWPYTANPVLNYLNTATDISDSNIAEFITFSQHKMEKAHQDKVRLSRFELNKLRQQVNLTKPHLMAYQQSHRAISAFETYLATYTPRRSPGIGSLPNGKDWYQARLNYFTHATQKPIAVLNQVLKVKSRLPQEPQFVVCFTSVACANQLGLDWRTGYSNRKSEFAAIPFGTEQAIIAEVDFGVHAQAWSSEHALTVLVKQLGVNQVQAQNILAKILKEPALAMVNIPLD